MIITVTMAPITPATTISILEFELLSSWQFAAELQLLQPAGHGTLTEVP